jgi:methyl-accepting chemotaxis protein
MKSFLDLSTRGKLFIGFGLMIVLLAIVAATAYRGIDLLQKTQKQLYEGVIADQLDLREVRSNQLAIRADVAVLFLLTDRSRQEELHAAIKARYERNGELMRKVIDRAQHSPERLTKAREFDAQRKLYRDVRENQVIPLIYAGKIDEAKQVFIGDQARRNELLEKLADELVEESERATALALVQAERAAAQSVRVLVAGAFIAIILAVVMTVFLSRVMADPLRALSELARRIAGGDLTVNLPESNRADETGVLMQTFHQMVTRLRELMREIGEGVNVLASSASEITASTTQVASGSAETASAVSETTSTVEEVKQTAQISTQKARYVSDTAQKVVQISQDGKKAIDDSVAAMGRIQEQMESVAESIVRLSEQGQAIGEIIATVNGLAEQSNLLAVNAGIEAAKAGEQGRGFAVVAQEVKSLAEQSKQATAQVRMILGDIQKATSSAVMATEQGSKAVDAGVRLSEQQGESIRILAEAIEEAAQAATQIAASAQQQMVGMDQVVLAMQNISQASVQNVASTRQAETAAQGLHGLGLSLKQLVEQYRM